MKSKTLHECLCNSYVYDCNIAIFQMNICDIFSNCAQNIDFEYLLEPTQRVPTLFGLEKKSEEKNLYDNKIWWLLNEINCVCFLSPF